MLATLKMAKDSRLPQAVGLCGDSDAFLELLNEAQSRLLSRGLWWGTFQKMRLCVTAGCVTWPRQVANVEAITVCNSPIPVHNEWFEFLSNGRGILHEKSSPPQLVDRGTFPSFADIIGTDKVIRIFTTVASDAGKQVLVRGLDANGLEVRSLHDGAWMDGVYVTLTATFVDTPVVFSVLTGVQKPETNGYLRVYEYDTVTLSSRTLAVYEPTELLPSYRRSLVTGLPCVSSCCGLKTIYAEVKLEFNPAKADTDYLIIGNLAALKFELKALQKEEDDLTKEAEVYHAKAIRELQHELRTYTGRDNVAVGLRINGSARTIKSQV